MILHEKYMNYIRNQARMGDDAEDERRLADLQHLGGRLAVPGRVDDLDLDRDGSLTAVLRGPGNEVHRRQLELHLAVRQRALDARVFLPVGYETRRGQHDVALDVTPEEVARIDGPRDDLVDERPRPREADA